MGFESIDQPGWSSEIEQNPKMSISFFWLERGGRWGLSPSTSLAYHQKFNVIQKQGFHFIGWRGVVDGVWGHRPVWPTSGVECNTKMSISFLWLERGGRWGLSPSTSLADHQKWTQSKKSISFYWLERGGRWGLSPLTSLADHQKLNIIQKWAFHFFGWRGVADGVWVHDQPSWSSEVECNPKMSISFFWLERGGGWGLSPSTSLANIIIQKEVECNTKMNVIQKWAFHFFGWRGVVDGVWVHDQPGQSSEVEHNTKMSISFLWLERGGGWGLSPSTSPADHQKLNIIQKEHFIFLAGEGWQMGFKSIDQPSWSSEVEHNPKMSISFFWLERGGGWGLSPPTSPADHQKLNVIQKWVFHFIGWRGVMDGVWVYHSTWPIIRSWV